jgi:hypothetical protein
MVKKKAGDDTCACPSNEEGYPARLPRGSIRKNSRNVSRRPKCSAMAESNIRLIDEGIDQPRREFVNVRPDRLGLTEQVSATEH